MARKRLAYIAIALLLAVAGAAGSIYWAAVQVPDFYQQALTEQPDPLVRRAEAKIFVQRTLRLVDDIKHSDSWSEEFEQQQINSWLAEELHRKYADAVPKGVSEPRVNLIDGVIEIGFHYKNKDWNGIVSLRLKPWVPEENQLALEIESIKAGLVPIPLDDVIKELSAKFKADSWKLEWSQSNGNDVLIVHFESEKENEPVLTGLQVDEGVVRVTGERRGAKQSMVFEMPRLANQSRR